MEECSSYPIELIPKTVHQLFHNSQIGPLTLQNFTHVNLLLLVLKTKLGKFLHGQGTISDELTIEDQFENDEILIISILNLMQS